MGYPHGHDTPISRYGSPGDFLWVKETFAEYILDETIGYWYRATEEDFSPLFVSFGYSWKPSIFMPRRASRIKLKIETIRIEQLQDITDNDAKSEGVTPVPFASGFDDNELHKSAFFRLWDSINAKRGYSVASNPFVWVIEFELAEQRILELEAEVARLRKMFPVIDWSNVPSCMICCVVYYDEDSNWRCDFYHLLADVNLHNYEFPYNLQLRPAQKDDNE